MRDLPSPTAERIHAIEREAFAKGYAQGERAGEKAASERTEAMLRRLASTINEIAALRAGAMHRAERELVKLALAIAERIVCREISADRDVVLVMARMAIARLGENAVATVHMNPSDVAAQVEVPPLRQDARGGRRCNVHAVFWEVCAGTIDTSVDAQIRELTRTLLGVYRRRTGGLRCRVAAEAGFSLDRYLARVPFAQPAPVVGRITRVVGLLVESAGPAASVGEICQVRTGRGAPLSVEVVGFRDGRLLSVPLGETAGIRPGDPIVSCGSALTIPIGDALLGRVIDGLGFPIDGRGPVVTNQEAPLRPEALNPLSRQPIATPIGTGVRAIDALLTCGRGQRIGVFGGSGVGKSTLLGMMARGTEADVVVLGLVGERGREVRSFLEHDLGPRGLERSVVVVSTSDSPPLTRQRAAYRDHAESFRDQASTSC
jgi:hypothetical protein